MKRIGVLTLGILSVGLAFGCANLAHGEEEKAKSDDKGKTVAVAQVKPAQAATTQPSWGKTTGTVKFTQKDDGKVRVQADLTGLPPGDHGFHIHVKGDLSAPDLTSAGPHFNPSGHKHAGPHEDSRHAGDLGNINADINGKAKLDITISGITIGGEEGTNIIGRSVIIHEKADDLKSDPTGNSGARIAGGVIEKK